MSRSKINDMVAVDAAWVGTMPDNWVLLPGRRLFRNRRQKSQPNDEQLAATQKYGVIPQKQFIELEDQKVVQALAGLDGFRHVEADDFVISLRSFQGGIERSRVAGCVSPAYTVLEPNLRALPHFYEYLLKSSGYISALQAVTQGIREGKTIHYEEFGEVVIPNPPLPEQRAIAKFLDIETAKIDALVNEQRKLIELLKEKRQALITQAVTKGLDPNVKMKDSGIEWLGEVPEHWEVSRLTWKGAHLSYGFTNPMPTADTGPCMLTANDIKDGYIDFENARCTSLEAFENELTEKSRPKSRDVLVTKDGTLGRAAVYDGRQSCINQSVASIRLDESQVNAEYLVFCFQSTTYLDRMLSEAGGTTIKHIYISRLANMALAIPPIKEQNQIAERVKHLSQKLSELVEQAENAEGILIERRSALISAAVTGKIDVRDLIDEEVEA